MSGKPIETTTTTSEAAAGTLLGAGTMPLTPTNNPKIDSAALLASLDHETLKKISLLTAVPEAKPATCWQSFVKVLKSCVSSTAPIIEGAIKWGTEAGTDALRELILNDPNFSEQQKALFIKIGPDALNAIAKGVNTQIANYAEANKASANPHLAAVTKLVTESGAIEAFVPGLAEGIKDAKADRHAAALKLSVPTTAVAETAILPVTPGTDSVTKLPVMPIVTECMLAAGLKQIGGKVGVLDLSAVSAALVIPDKVIDAQIKSSLATSGLTIKEQGALISSGAAKAFVMKAILVRHNEDVIKAACGHGGATEIHTVHLSPIEEVTIPAQVNVMVTGDATDTLHTEAVA